MIEQRQQRVPESPDVGDHDGLAMAAELGPGDLLDQLLERADAARQRHEAVGALEHDALALVHVARDDDLLGARHDVLAAGEELGDDAGHAPAVIEHAGRQRSHQAERAAAVDQPDPVLGEDLSQLAGRFGKRRIGAGAGAAIDAQRSNHTHSRLWHWLSGSVKAAAPRSCGAPLGLAPASKNAGPAAPQSGAKSAFPSRPPAERGDQSRKRAYMRP